MKFISRIIILLILVGFSGIVQKSFCQIVESVDGPLIDKSTDSSEKNVCYPQCRKGYACHNGNCVSICNPPCGQGMECGEDGDCHTVISIMRDKLGVISNYSTVSKPDEISQGFILTTNRQNTIVKIGDTTFKFNKELCVVSPQGKSTIIADAPNSFVNKNSVEVKSGSVERVNLNFRPVKININPCLGPSWIKGQPLLAGDINAGINIFNIHYFGLTCSYIGPLDDNYEYLTNPLDGVYPDTLREIYNELLGGGVTYGYMGFKKFNKMLTISPQLTIGYWKCGEAVYFYKKSLLSSSDISSLEQHKIFNYYAKPGIEVRLGYRVFSLSAELASYIGDSNPIFSITIGVILSIL